MSSLTAKHPAMSSNDNTNNIDTTNNKNDDKAPCLDQSMMGLLNWLRRAGLENGAGLHSMIITIIIQSY